jgi:multidrug resistance efflux pump
MTQQLYREEALANAGLQFLGEARLNSAKNALLLSVALCIGLLLATWTIGTFDYSRKHLVQGAIDEPNTTSIVAVDFAELSDLAVSEGDYVQKGQYLGKTIRIADQAATTSLTEEITGQLEHWRALAKLLNASHESQRTDLKQRDQQLARLSTLTRNDVDLQQQKVIGLEEQLKRTKQLRDKGYLSNIDWLSFKTSMISERQALTRQQRTLVEFARQRLDIRHQLNALQHDTQRRLAETRLQHSEARKELLRNRLANQHQLLAPSSGVVSRIQATLNQLLKPGEVILYVSGGSNEYSGTLYIPTYAAANIQVGQELELEVDAFPVDTHGKIKATITHFSNHLVTRGERNESYLARLTIHPNESITRFLPGMKFQTHLKVEQKSLFAWALSPIFRLREAT